MTNKEALVAVLQVSTDDNALDKAMIDRGITGTDNYSSDGAKSIDLAAIDILQALLSTPDVTEGGYSIVYDRAAVEKRLLYLCNKNGIVFQLRSTVRGRSPW